MKSRDGAIRERGPHPLDNWLFGLALTGIALTSYLTFTAWFGEHPAFCGTGSDWDFVQQSRWSSLLGLPIAYWGFLTYALLARFFGTYWCPSCQQQKALFEASAGRLPYVECTPGGRSGPVNFDCVANDIKSYSTWIIGGGRHTGVVPADELARLSGFEWSLDAARKK